MTKYEVKLFVQTTEVYIVEAEDRAAAVDLAIDAFHNGKDADVPGYGDGRIADTDVEELED